MAENRPYIYHIICCNKINHNGNKIRKIIYRMETSILKAICTWSQKNATILVEEDDQMSLGHAFLIVVTSLLRWPEPLGTQKPHYTRSDQKYPGQNIFSRNF
jgi:hypothetical protein